MGTIKITDEKIITVKDGIKETWELIIDGFFDKSFIVYDKKKYNLIKKEVSE